MGGVKPALDPFEWSDCSAGSIWMPLGDQLISSGMATRVFFMPIAVAHATARDWLPGGTAFGKLTTAIDLANRNKIKFDYAFWQQGDSDTRTPGRQYYQQMRDVIKYVSLNLKVGKWIVARGAGCAENTRKEIVNSQLTIGRQPLYRRYAGPDSSTLLPSDRSGGCGLSENGQWKMAALWAESIRAADKAEDLYQKEFLLDYFRHR
jgi:hypothetical protein